MIKSELKKVLHYKNFRIILLTGWLLAVFQTVYFRFFYYPGLMGNLKDAMEGGIYSGYVQPPVVLQGWLGMDFT